MLKPAERPANPAGRVPCASCRSGDRLPAVAPRTANREPGSRVAHEEKGGSVRDGRTISPTPVAGEGRRLRQRRRFACRRPGQCTPQPSTVSRGVVRVRGRNRRRHDSRTSGTRGPPGARASAQRRVDSSNHPAAIVAIVLPSAPAPTREASDCDRGMPSRRGRAGGGNGRQVAGRIGRCVVRPRSCCSSPPAHACRPAHSPLRKPRVSGWTRRRSVRSASWR